MVALSALWQQRKPELICGAMSIGALLFLGHFLVRRHTHVDSANALLQGYPIALGTPAEGEVVEVLVRENQRVKMGQLLCRLEDKKPRAALLGAESRLASVRIRTEEAARDRDRLEWLAQRQGVSRRDRDLAKARYQTLAAEQAAAEAVTRASRTILARTLVTAPANGVIAFRTAQPGFYARAGAPLFGFVPDDGRWVEAKVKETDLASVRVGDPVEIDFDASPGRTFHGQVASLSPVTEVPFATIPTDPAAGNFTKYVQWHPVRVALDLADNDLARIPVGTSAEVHMRRR